MKGIKKFEKKQIDVKDLRQIAPSLKITRIHSQSPYVSSKNLRNANLISKVTQIMVSNYGPHDVLHICFARDN